MNGSLFDHSGEYRRLKAAILGFGIYAIVAILHWVTFASMVLLVLVTLLCLHALRLLLTPPPPHSEPLPAEAVEWPVFSLLVAAKNEEAVIANLVKNLCELDYPAERLEVWVIDDNSSDRTAEVLSECQKGYPQLNVLRRGGDAKGGKSGALNQVLPLTNGEIIGVFDADAQVTIDVLRAIAPLFQRPRLGAVQLRKAIANAPLNFWTRGQEAEMALDIFFQERRIRTGGIGELRGNGQFVRRDALLDCGGWNEQTITDDLDLTLRLHLQQWDIDCLTFPAVEEEGVTTFKQLWHQRNRWAEGGYQRYLDYWQLLLGARRLSLKKMIDLLSFLLMQYLLPTALLPDAIAAIILRERPVLSPLGIMAFSLSTIAMYLGVRRAYQRPWWQAAFQTILGTLYMLHWIPVMVSVTLRMAIRPKRLKWIKTVHQGIPVATTN